MANGESYRDVALGQGGSAAPPGDVKQAVKPLINDAEGVSLNIALGEPDSTPQPSTDRGAGVSWTLNHSNAVR